VKTFALALHPQCPGQRQRQVLFQQAGRSARPRVRSAVAWINNHYGKRFALRGSRRLWHGGGLG
jgi:hypothetical protein